MNFPFIRSPDGFARSGTLFVEAAFLSFGPTFALNAATSALRGSSKTRFLVSSSFFFSDRVLLLGGSSESALPSSS